MDKRNIASSTDYKFDLDKLDHLNPLEVLTKQNRKELAISAQDLIALEPVLVSHSTNGPLVVSYEKLTVLLLSIVKQQEERIKALESKPKSRSAKKG